ncbi:hypothetical protein ABBQ38_008988 [Trebouxia sp. C0009 RCD-2024]
MFWAMTTSHYGWSCHEPGKSRYKQHRTIAFFVFFFFFFFWAPSANAVMPGFSTGDGYGPVRRQKGKGKSNGRGKPNYAGAAPGAPPNRPMYDCALHGRCFFFFFLGYRGDVYS